MKKTIAILLSLMMVMCLAACGNSAGQADRSSTENNPTENAAGNDAESSTGSETQSESSAEEGVQTESSEEGAQTENSDTQAEAESTGAAGTEDAGSSEEQQPEAEAPETQGGKVLVAYFSATGTTEGVAQHIADGLGADIYEIIPEEPYTDADLDYNDNNSRSTIEMNDSSSRPAISGSVENMEQYDIVFIGYPIWWGEAPRIVSTFVESYDFSGKTVVPFCTSGGSGVGSSGTNLAQLTSGAQWLDGRRLNGGDSQDVVMEWVNGLGLELGE